MSTKMIVHNGVEMLPEWPQQINEAQAITSVSIAGKTYSRLRFGEESDDWGADARHVMIAAS